MHYDPRIFRPCNLLKEENTVMVNSGISSIAVLRLRNTCSYMINVYRTVFATNATLSFNLWHKCCYSRMIISIGLRTSSSYRNHILIKTALKEL